MMPAGRNDLGLFEGFNLAGMTYDQAWIAQVGVGGEADPLEVEAYILGLLRPDAYQHNVIAQALNEYFLERGQDHPVAYVSPVTPPA